MAESFLTVSLIVILVLAARQDLSQHRISNFLTTGALTAGFGMQWLAHGGGGALLALAGAGVGLFCLLPFYLLKGMGAGDVKLMAAAGAFLGPVDAFIAALLSLAAGALLAILVVAWRVANSPATSPLAGHDATSSAKPRSALARAAAERFPYAAAIAVGVVATLWFRGFLRPLDGSLA